MKALLKWVLLLGMISVLAAGCKTAPSKKTASKPAIEQASHSQQNAETSTNRVVEDESGEDTGYHPPTGTPESLAMSGSMKIIDAGHMMKTFADANPKSYHYFEASQLVGDLLVAIGSYGPATEYYRRLDDAQARCPACGDRR